jgi:hypothetical protein
MKLTISGSTYRLPASFSSLTCGQFVKLWKVRQGTIYQRLAAVLNCDEQQLNNIPLAMVAELAKRCEWMDDIEMYLQTVRPADLDPKLVEGKPYASVAKVQQLLMREKGDIIAACIGIVQEYCDKDLTDEPVTEGLGLFRFFTIRCHPSLIAGHGWPNWKPRKMKILLQRELTDYLPSGISTRYLNWFRSRD